MKTTIRSISVLDCSWRNFSSIAVSVAVSLVMSVVVTRPNSLPSCFLNASMTALASVWAYWSCQFNGRRSYLLIPTENIWRFCWRSCEWLQMTSTYLGLLEKPRLSYAILVIRWYHKLEECSIPFQFDNLPMEFRGLVYHSRTSAMNDWLLIQRYDGSVKILLWI